MGLQLLQSAVPRGAHPGGKLSTSRSDGRRYLERREAGPQLGCDERVHGQVDEDLAEPEGRQPEISEHLECMGNLMDGDEVEK